jgi:hypothetical protein
MDRLCTEKVMDMADVVVVLQDGQVHEICSPAKLPHSLENVCNVEDSNMIQASASVTGNTESTKSHPEPSEEPFGETLAPPSDHGNDDSRRQGDLSVYKYYLQRAGFASVALYGVSVTSWMFCTEFSSKWSGGPHFHQWHNTVQGLNSLQRYGSSGGQKPIPRRQTRISACTLGYT